MKRLKKFLRKVKFIATHRIKVKCFNCFKVNRLNEVIIIESRIEYGGPYCTECGEKLELTKKSS